MLDPIPDKDTSSYVTSRNAIQVKLSVSSVQWKIALHPAE